MYRTVVTVCTAQLTHCTASGTTRYPLIYRQNSAQHRAQFWDRAHSHVPSVLLFVAAIYLSLSLCLSMLSLSLSLSLCRLVRTISKSVCYSRHVRPSVRMYHLGCHWTDTPEIWYRVLLCKSVEKIHIWLQSDKNYRNALRLEYIYFCRRRTRSSREMLSGC